MRAWVHDRTMPQPPLRQLTIHKEHEESVKNPVAVTSRPKACNSDFSYEFGVVSSRVPTRREDINENLMR